MSGGKWNIPTPIIRLFQGVGRASLLYDIQDSHSGNMAVKHTDKKGREQIIITATGSQKGDLEPQHLCALSPNHTDFGYYKASSETDIHAEILNLKGVKASLHAHTKDLVIATLDHEKKPNQPPPFLPVDPLGYHAAGTIPVDWFRVPSGSPEMIKKIPQRLKHHPAAVIQGHGVMTRGRTLQEAFYLSCVANNSGYIFRLLEKWGVETDVLQKRIHSDPSSCFSPTSPYTVDDDHVCEFPQEEELIKEFYKTGARIFESRLSPFHTGSFSLRGVKTMFFAPKASMPRELRGPLLEKSLEKTHSDSEEERTHKEIYHRSDFQTVLHCYIPEAEALSQIIPSGAKSLPDRIVPIDAEGSFFYLVIPVLPSQHSTDTFLQFLHDYKVVIVRGGGVWAVGEQSLSEVLHHPSSIREICLYRLGAMERGLDLGKMEPSKAKKW